MRKLTFALLVATVLAGATALWAWRSYDEFLDTPLAPADGGALIDVQRGDGLADVVAALGETADWRWRVLGRLDPNAARLQVGEYRVETGTTPLELLSKLAAGDVVLHAFTIVEGWNLRELRAAMGANTVLLSTLSAVPDSDLPARLGIEGPSAEGQFLPETYRFPRGTTDEAFLRRAHADLRRVLARLWEQRAQGLPLETPYEALILASIIEKETGVAGERGRIAGVFARRLQRGMRLQTDPTVIYGLGVAFDGDIRRRDLRTDTPYNTYTRHGLPPTPIAMAGEPALHAALHPEPGEALYFVATGTGGHHFSATLEEHNAAVRRYQLGQR